jgi:kynureninase
MRYERTLEFARGLDAGDELRGMRAEFCLPRGRDVGAEGEWGEREAAYLTGNSLGLMARGVREAVGRELEDWAKFGVEGHFHGANPWVSYHEPFRELLAPVVGARASEVVVMNTLTVNLHLLMASFYRPTRARWKIVVEDGAFPSDSYAVDSQADWHGLTPAEAVVRLKPRAGEEVLRTQDVLAYLREHGAEVALVMLAGVNYRTGQVFDMDAITAAGHGCGAVVGWDLAHAVGNVPLRLHDGGGSEGYGGGADFAVWCSYKYLNGGPGAVGGAFVHERHHRRVDLKQLAGWWGNDPAERFRMEDGFRPVGSVDRWAMSNPPILSLAPLRVSLELFKRAGLERLRAKSRGMTEYLSWLLEGARGVEVITPKGEWERGCQFSLRVRGEGGGGAKAKLEELKRRGVVCDFRSPDVIRAAPVPLYNSYEDVWRLAAGLGLVGGV